MNYFHSMSLGKRFCRTLKIFIDRVMARREILHSLKLERIVGSTHCWRQRPAEKLKKRTFSLPYRDLRYPKFFILGRRNIVDCFENFHLQVISATSSLIFFCKLPGSSLQVVKISSSLIVPRRLAYLIYIVSWLYIGF